MVSGYTFSVRGLTCACLDDREQPTVGGKGNYHTNGDRGEPDRTRNGVLLGSLVSAPAFDTVCASCSKILFHYLSPYLAVQTQAAISTIMVAAMRRPKAQAVVHAQLDTIVGPDTCAFLRLPF